MLNHNAIASDPYLTEKITYFNVIVVFQAFLNVIQKLKDIQTVQAAVQQSVHAFKRRLTDIQPIIYRVLEGAHLNLRCDLTCHNLVGSTLTFFKRI